MSETRRPAQSWVLGVLAVSVLAAALLLLVASVLPGAERCAELSRSAGPGRVEVGAASCTLTTPSGERTSWYLSPAQLALVGAVLSLGGGALEALRRAGTGTTQDDPER